MVVGYLVYQDVIDEAAVFVKQPGVVGLADFETANSVGGDGIGESLRLRPADLDLTHVADVEKADRSADGLVLVDNPGVLDGHVPPAEVDHPGLEASVDR